MSNLNKKDVKDNIMDKKIESYSELSRTVNAYQNCVINDNEVWETKHLERIEEFIKEKMPYGSGFGEITLDIDKCDPYRLVFYTTFTIFEDHTTIDMRITIKANLMFGHEIKIVGNFGKNIYLKEYIHDVFSI